MFTSIMYVQLYYYLNPEAQSSRGRERERETRQRQGRDKQVVEKVRLRWALNQLMSKILV